MVDVRGDVLRPPHGTTPASTKLTTITLCTLCLVALWNKGLSVVSRGFIELRAFCWHQNFVPKGFSALAPWGWGLYTCIKSLKMCIKSVQRDQFESCNIWAKRKGHFVVIKILSLMDCLHQPGAIYVYMVEHEKHVYKISLQSIFLNLQQMGKMIRAFFWHQKFVPKGLSALAPGLYTYIKSLKFGIKSDCEEIILKLATYG